MAENYRNGMWVIYNDGFWENQPGILVKQILKEGGVRWDVHCVAADGTTAAVVNGVDYRTKCRQARNSEIPESRRPDEGKAAALGYV